MSCNTVLSGKSRSRQDCARREGSGGEIEAEAVNSCCVTEVAHRRWSTRSEPRAGSAGQVVLPQPVIVDQIPGDMVVVAVVVGVPSRAAGQGQRRPMECRSSPAVFEQQQSRMDTMPGRMQRFDAFSGDQAMPPGPRPGMVRASYCPPDFQGPNFLLSQARGQSRSSSRGRNAASVSTA